MTVVQHWSIQCRGQCLLNNKPFLEPTNSLNQWTRYLLVNLCPLWSQTTMIISPVRKEDRVSLVSFSSELFCQCRCHALTICFRLRFVENQFHAKSESAFKMHHYINSHDSDFSEWSGSSNRMSLYICLRKFLRTKEKPNYTLKIRPRVHNDYTMH